MIKKAVVISVAAAVVLCVFAGVSYGQNQTIPLPTFRFGVEGAQTPQDVAFSLQIIFLFTVLALAPSILMVMTCFTRIVIVFHFLRTALGTAQMPPNQILVGMALLLTFYIMAPVFNQVNERALLPINESER